MDKRRAMIVGIHNHRLNCAKGSFDLTQGRAMSEQFSGIAASQTGAVQLSFG